MEKLLSLRHCEILRDANYTKIPITVYPMTEEGMVEFNEIYFELKDRSLNKIVRTQSGGISIARHNFRPPMWDVRNTKSCIEMTIILTEGMWRIQFRNYEAKDKKQVYGKTAFKHFLAVCDKFGIDMEDYAIDNGAEVKEEIESPMIDLLAKPNKVYHNVHHLDLNSSHIAGMVKYHPYLRQPFEEIYTKRKEQGKEIYKDILTHTWGYLQSISQCKARWAHISRDGIKYTNERLRELSEELVSSGRKVLAYNTDGIWYQGEVFHNDSEGKQIGQWKNDHINCMWRPKSKGAYEYIEDGVYTPVIRGRTRLDKIKPREEWEWGDIYQEEATIICFCWSEEDGITLDD